MPPLLARTTGRLAATLVLGALAAAPAAAQNLVANGGFETGDLTGWLSTPDTPGLTFGVDSDPNNVHSGTYGAFTGAGRPLATLSQTLAVAPGARYTFSFYLDNFFGRGDDGTAPSAFTARWNGETLLGLVDTDHFGFTRFSYTVVADAATAEIEFGARHVPQYWGLDDVSVVRAGVVPEPGTWALLATGLAGVAGVTRRRGGTALP